MARLRSCKYCGKIHSVDHICNQRPKRAKEPTEIVKLRGCRRWRTAREDALERDHHLCRVCLMNKTLTQKDLEVHHITPLREDHDLAYELDNLITLCKRHHEDADAGLIIREALRRLTQEPICL